MLGCTYPLACNYSPLAETDDGSCVFPPFGCEFGEGAGCTYPEALNFAPSAVFDDGSCEFGFTTPCWGDLDGDGTAGVPDLLQMLSAFGATCEG